MYSITEKVLKSGTHVKRVPVITFHDPNMAIVGEFLMTDAIMLADQIRKAMNLVVSGETEKVALSGNRTSLILKKDMTTITDLWIDLFPDVQTYPSYVIKTSKLMDLIAMWREQTEES